MRSHWTAAAIGRKHETLFPIGRQCRWCAPRRRDNGGGVGGDGATWSDDGRSQPLCTRHSALTPRLTPSLQDTTNKPSGDDQFSLVLAIFLVALNFSRCSSQLTDLLKFFRMHYSVACRIISISYRFLSSHFNVILRA